MIAEEERVHNAYQATLPPPPSETNVLELLQTVAIYVTLSATTKRYTAPTVLDEEGVL